ncbi:MAG: hypothetical protein QM765_22815 [Myxococcales bacterium]
MVPRSVLVALLSLLLLLLTGCPGTEKCRVGSDCASGICLSTGECGHRSYPDADLPINWPDTGEPAPEDASQPAGEDASVAEVDGSVSPGSDAEAPAPVDGGAPKEDASVTTPPDGSVSLPDAGPIQTCSANHDGVITKDELPVVLGAKATFVVAQNVPVDTVGVQQANGTVVWDLSGALSGDTKVEFSPTSLAGAWFESVFPGAQFSLRMAGSADTLGVLQATSDGLLLHGMVSPTESDGATKVQYLKDDYSEDPAPVTTVAYPVQTGKTWTSAGILEGDYGGATYHCDPTLVSCTPYPNCCIRHVYESTADKAGKVITPLGTFDVVRIKNTIKFQTLTFGVWYGFRTVRSFVFVSECYGTVASMVAKDDESEEEFTTAAEVRRLSP